MKGLKPYTIQYVGLKVGEHQFEYIIDKTFFDHFEFTDFNDADVTINLVLDKRSTLMDLHFTAEGVVNVNCDVTNEPYNQEIEGELDLVIKFGDAFNDEDDDILILPHGEYEVSVAQYIYELIVLSVPNKKVHPGIQDGTLQSDILDKLEELRVKAQGEQKNDTEDTDPRWDELKKLLTDKKNT